MKRHLYLFVLGLPVLFLSCSATPPPEVAEVYFTDPVEPGSSNPLQRALLEVLSKAQHTIDAAVHSFDHPDVWGALQTACALGVRVRVLLDGEAGGVAGDTGCPVVRVFHPTRSQHGLMHHKFAVIDDETVWTGSANWTRSGLRVNANDAVVLRDRAFAASFTQQFEWLYAGGPAEAYRLPYQPRVLRKGSSQATAYFSPDPQVENVVIRQLNRAQHQITLALFYFTNGPIYRALLDAMGRGVSVVALVGRRGAHDCALSMFDELQALGVATVMPIEGAFHHKLAIIDGRVVLTGSANWTASGFHRNFENLLVLEDASLALSYLAHLRALKRGADIYAAGTAVRTVSHHFNTLPGTARLEWHPLQRGDVVGYEVCRSPQDGAPCVSVARVAGAGANFYVDANVLPGQRYLYRVRALMDTGAGDYSPPVAQDVPPDTRLDERNAARARTGTTWVQFRNAHVTVYASGHWRLEAELGGTRFQAWIPHCAAARFAAAGWKTSQFEGATFWVGGELVRRAAWEIAVFDPGQIQWEDERH